MEQTIYVLRYIAFLFRSYNIKTLPIDDFCVFHIIAIFHKYYFPKRH